MDAEVSKLLQVKARLNNNEDNTKSKFILKTPKGMQDYGPQQTSVREVVFETITKCFKRHGGQSIDTPVCELKETLTGKYGEDSKLIYDLADQGGEILSLRYDLTVPFARYLAQNKVGNLKRYQIGKVYRRDNPVMTKGRYREFYQCDFDIAGPGHPLIADSECLRVVYEILHSLDIKCFEIKVNSRKILEGLASVCGVPDGKFKLICSSIDKLDKLSWEEVKREMCTEKGLEESVANKIGEFVKLSGDISLADKLLASDLGTNEAAKQGIEEVKLLFKYCAAMGIDKVMKFDLSLARGLDYYTGVIFETILSGEQEVGSIAAGGRYDDLVALFSDKKHSVPCVGVSIGIERIFTIMERNEAARKFYPTKCFVMSAGKDMTVERFKILTELWNADIPSEHSLKSNPKPLTQYQFCEEKGIPFIITIGGDELSKGIVKIRDIRKRVDVEVKRVEMVQHLKKLIDEM
ncbi:histidine--tRNA ligase: cytoplasmic-like protein [Leptotrombidium deliense]|uniref:histidine--tRNA ligase n=1 Tax=Leptotrombidium deliense TaxID=299467 RepID=A0A443SWB9_9ACAR|nr:histidine--tRNA ligase: cytoplasmic-like protein [Leptotrombidium deliense]